MHTDVIICGAGPTGLMLAAELRLAGVRVTVLERLAEPTGQSRGLGFTARAMEVFDQRGLLAAFRHPAASPLGHFGGLRFDYSILPGSHFGARDVPQSRTEAVLEQWARGLGVDIRRGWELLELSDDDTTGDGDGVTVLVASPAGQRRLRAAYLVGCDGGQSIVRRLAGFEFPGTPATRGMYLADIVGAGIRPRPLGERLAAGMVMAAPLSPGVDRIIVCPHDAPAVERTHAVPFAEVAAAWQRITGESIAQHTATWVSSFSDASRQASEYRRGRVLLAGDAAHIHLPAGGQGLSVGVQDAVNLGWKLAATVRGWAPPVLLDTYHHERHPVGVRLLVNTGAQNLLFLGGAEAAPLRDLFGELLAIDDVRRHLSGMTSGLDIRYDTGGIGDDGDQDTALLGRRLPPQPLRAADGTATSTVRLLHPARGVLLDLADDPRARAAAAGWTDRVDVHTVRPRDPGAFGDATALLVRPDGHVVAAPRGGPRALTPALTRWFGAPLASRPADQPTGAAAVTA